jgi:hypothetical protein
VTIVNRYADVRYQRNVQDCWDFARRVLLEHNGSDIGERLPDVSRRRKAVVLNEPCEGCIVLLTRRNAAHVGVWIRGAMVHLSKDGPRHEPLRRAMVREGYLKVKFYDPAH